MAFFKFYKGGKNMYYCEYVSPAHKKRLEGFIVYHLVDHLNWYSKGAICDLKCKIKAKNKILISGTIICKPEAIKLPKGYIQKIVRNLYYGKMSRKNLEEDYERDVYYSGVSPKTVYNKRLDVPEDIEVIVEIETIIDPEKVEYYMEHVLEDTVVTGYAVNFVQTKYLPISYYLALKFGDHLSGVIDDMGSYRTLCNYATELNIPTFKIAVGIIFDGFRYRHRNIIISLPRKRKGQYTPQTLAILRSSLLSPKFAGRKLEFLNHMGGDRIVFKRGFSDLEKKGYFDSECFKPNCFNGYGLYGPSILDFKKKVNGKDYYNINVCGAVRARQLALLLLREKGYYSVFVKIKYKKDSKEPETIEAYSIDELGKEERIPDELLPEKSWFSKEAIRKDTQFEDFDWMMNLGLDAFDEFDSSI